MAHRTLIISEEAYAALAKLKTQNESFTDVILRISKQKVVGKLYGYIVKIGSNEELARNVERASKHLRKAKLRNAMF